MKELDNHLAVCRTSRLTGKQTWMELKFRGEEVVFTEYRGNGPLLRADEFKDIPAEEILRDHFNHRLDWWARTAFTYSVKMAYVGTMKGVCDTLSKL